MPPCLFNKLNVICWDEKMLFILFVISSVAVQAQELVTYEVPRDVLFST